MTGDEIKRLVEMAKAGMTRREAAQELGYHYFTVSEWVRRLKIPFKHGHHKEKPKRPRGRTPIAQIKSAGILDQMTEKERSDSLVMMRKGAMSASEALTYVGRVDLVEKLKEVV